MSIVDLLAQHSEEELIALKLRLEKRVTFLKVEKEQIEEAIARKAATTTGEAASPDRERQQ